MVRPRVATDQTTGGFSPPVASRALGYVGIALYEAVVPGMPDFQSLEGQLDGLSGLPGERGRVEFHWPTAANAALAGILRSLFSTTPAENMAALDALETSFADRFRPLDRAVSRRSQRRGTAVAEAIFEWSKGDGGDRRELRNFPVDHVPPVGPGLLAARAAQVHASLAAVLGRQPPVRRFDRLGVRAR